MQNFIKIHVIIEKNSVLLNFNSGLICKNGNDFHNRL